MLGGLKWGCHTKKLVLIQAPIFGFTHWHYPGILNLSKSNHQHHQQTQHYAKKSLFLFDTLLFYVFNAGVVFPDLKLSHIIGREGPLNGFCLLLK
jgi:hypothetical protein